MDEGGFGHIHGCLLFNNHGINFPRTYEFQQQVTVDHSAEQTAMAQRPVFRFDREWN
ncbi:unnamed protein product [Rotaria magnacalcarata]|uniref:Uncharacterized protein n=1 Tax=Rotaria magnacalcarata TaxID=392030 RepID=A0A820B029_9BILA|nr:unnamed protein product [Rotaria magnacalcarata]